MQNWRTIKLGELIENPRITRQGSHAAHYAGDDRFEWVVSSRYLAAVPAWPAARKSSSMHTPQLPEAADNTPPSSKQSRDAG